MIGVWHRIYLITINNSMSTEKEFTPDDLPKKEVFKKKEVFQHPQPADSGTPLNKDEKKEDRIDEGKEEQRSSKEEGLNETRSSGNAGAFEGFEDQQEK